MGVRASEENSDETKEYQFDFAKSVQPANVVAVIVYLCEKPSQAADLARILECRKRERSYFEGGCIRVTWCLGHLLELAPPEQLHPRYRVWNWEDLPILPHTWEKVPLLKTQEHLTDIVNLLNAAASVVIATDADREGELIAREILDFCNFKGPLYRLWLTSLDDLSLKAALADLRSAAVTDGLYQAALARQQADWLIGLNLSRAMTLALGSFEMKSYSVGRVQSPTLQLVAQRDTQIRNHVPISQWILDCTFQTNDGIPLHWRSLPLTLEELTSMEHDLRLSPLVLDQRSVELKKEPPPLPYTLSDLQQVASILFQLTAQQTANITQRLYDGYKAISYPRTDCPYLPDSQHPFAKALLQHLRTLDRKFSPLCDLADPHRKSDAWNTRRLGSHHGLIPILNGGVDLSAMSSDEKSILTLICESYIRLFLPDSVREVLTLKGHCQTRSLQFQFEQPVHLGWKWGLTRPDTSFHFSSGRTVWDLAPSESLSLFECKRQETTRQGPSTFQEGELIGAMKNAGGRHPGLGTEATRANVIETLVERGYLKRHKLNLTTTRKADRLLKVLPPVMLEADLTVEWETQLSQIERGQLTRDQFIQQQCEWLLHLFEKLTVNDQLPLDW